MSKKLDGKVALVTGGTSGIGLATVGAFVDEGAHVFVTGRREAELAKVKEKFGAHVTTVQADSGKLADLDRLYAEIGKSGKKLDVIFANAGGGEMKPLGQLTEAHFDSTFNGNVKGVVFTLEKGLPHLRDGASVILNGSTTSITGTPAFSIYSASKAAVRNFARSALLDLKGRGIRVNVVSPGPTHTTGLAELGGKDEASQKGLLDYMASQVPMGRLGKPEEIARSVVFLASPDSSFVNGVELFVDGGIAQV